MLHFILSKKKILCKLGGIREEIQFGASLCHWQEFVFAGAAIRFAYSRRENYIEWSGKKIWFCDNARWKRIDDFNLGNLSGVIMDTISPPVNLWILTRHYYVFLMLYFSFLGRDMQAASHNSTIKFLSLSLSLSMHRHWLLYQKAIRSFCMSTLKADW